MITKIKRIRGDLFLILSKPILKSMGLKIGMKLLFHVEKERLILTPVTNIKGLRKRLKSHLGKTYNTKQVSIIY